RNKRPGGEFSAGSMADITFLLLLFFLVTTNIDVDTGIGMTLPEKVEEELIVPMSKERLASLLINENGDVLLNGEIIAIPQISETLIDRITSKIELPKNKKLVVSIKTDRNTNYNLYIKSLDQVKVAFYKVQNDYAMGKWGISRKDVDDEQKKILTEKIPIIISIAEPEKIK
ncbi:MAG: biopolymer transporter ExbD, partial [Ignavibacteriae bacterium]|nr:biopolymer transporter ExbD [Ignavibacteriota bacterium]